MKRRMPNFFLAGAPKAGTTSLYHVLSQHPDIFMSPVKEPTFFAEEARAENMVPYLQATVRQQEREVREALKGGISGNSVRGVVSRWEDYVQLFAGVTHERAIGEASVTYLWSGTAVPRIVQMNPAARFLVILRNPAERAFSQYLHYVSDGHVSCSFGEHVSRSLRHDRRMSTHHPFLEFGMYGEQLERLYRLVPRAQVGVWLYEDTLRDPSAFHREVFRFLGVDESFVPNAQKRYHQMEIPRQLHVARLLKRSGAWTPLRAAVSGRWRRALKAAFYRRPGALRMGAEDRKLLCDLYCDDISKLEALLGRDLSAWKRA